MKAPKDLGMILLAAWLILFGLLTAPFIRVSFAHSGDVLAVAAGVLLMKRQGRCIEKVGWPIGPSVPGGRGRRLRTRHSHLRL
jgi:hypothetical protein